MYCLNSPRNSVPLNRPVSHTVRFGICTLPSRWIGPRNPPNRYCATLDPKVPEGQFRRATDRTLPHRDGGADIEAVVALQGVRDGRCCGWSSGRDRRRRWNWLRDAFTVCAAKQKRASHHRNESLLQIHGLVSHVPPVQSASIIPPCVWQPLRWQGRGEARSRASPLAVS